MATDVDALSHSTLFWRSFSHFIGGMGVLVFVLALTPRSHASSYQMMKAEVPCPLFGKLASKLTDTARILYLIYIGLSLILFIFLLFGGMSVFDALCHTFGTAGKGGFGIYSDSVAHYSSSYLHIVLTIGMIVFGINFNLYYLLLMCHVKDFFHDEELRWYLGIILLAIFLIAGNVWHLYDNVFYLCRDVSFTVASIITTTRFTTANYDLWPMFSHIILLLLIIIGGCAGSTAGGLKVSRVVVNLKIAKNELIRKLQPGRILVTKINKDPFPAKEQRGLHAYMIAYLLIFVVLLLFVSREAGDFSSAFSSVCATFNNVGPGLYRVGPTGNFFHYSQPVKFLLSLGMIAGRLEIWPILILFSAHTWRKN